MIPTPRSGATRRSTAADAAARPPVALDRERFRTVVDGKPVDLFALENEGGMAVRITNYGAKIQQIVVPDRLGRPGDVVLGYESIEAVIGGQPSMGAFVGRYANRIAGGQFTLDGVRYRLSLNDGNGRPNTLHGGVRGSRVRVFDAVQRSRSSVEMSLLFEEADDGFPGTLSLRVRYHLGADNDLFVDYAAEARDKRTVVNFTSHAFFNLSGDPAQSILDTEIELNASKVLDMDPNFIPTGALLDVTGTPMDFRRPKSLGADIEAEYPLLRIGNGYDHAYVLDERDPPAQRAGYEDLRFVARAREETFGRTMEVWSTEPSVHLVSGNGLAAQDPRDRGKGGVLFPFRSGFCLEPQHYPDSVNHPAFPSTVLDAGHTYEGRIVYRFGSDG